MSDSPFKLVIGFSPGSASHDAALSVAPVLERETGRKVELDWRPGESGAWAARYVAESTRDGDTLLLATLGTHAILPNVSADSGYDPVADFTPLAVLTMAPLVLGVFPGIAARTLAEFIEWVRNQPTPPSFGSSAVGGTPHLAGAWFAEVAGVELRHRVYNDTRKLYDDLVSGRIAMSFNNLASMRPMLSAQKIVGLGVTGARRVPELPELPTMIEAGLAGFEITNWVALLAPARIPRARAEQLSRAAGEQRQSELGAWIKSERDRFGAIVRRLGWEKPAS